MHLTDDKHSTVSRIESSGAGIGDEAAVVS